MDLILRFVADGLVVIIFLLAMYAFVFLVPKKERTVWAIKIVLAGLTSYLVARLVALVYQPTTMRPFEKLGVDPGAAYIANPGFPSDHALFAMFLTLAVWYSTKNKPLALVMLVLTLIMGAGRVVALVHTPLDIIGGLLFALVGVVWYRLNLKNVVK